MKKFLVVMALLLVGVVANAQKHFVYCDMMAYNSFGVGKVKVQLDMGHIAKNKGFESLYDENDKKIKFNTVMEAINYMAKNGWKLVQTYYLSEGMSQKMVVHYVMEKEVEKEEDIYEGLKLKPEE